MSFHPDGKLKRKIQVWHKFSYGLDFFVILIIILKFRNVNFILLKIHTKVDMISIK